MDDSKMRRSSGYVRDTSRPPPESSTQGPTTLGRWHLPAEEIVRKIEVESEELQSRDGNHPAYSLWISLPSSPFKQESIHLLPGHIS